MNQREKEIIKQSFGVIVPPTPPFLRTPYNYDMNAAGDESALQCKDKTRTQQQFKEETDINTIVERFGISGKLPDNIRMPTYGDFTDTFDFQSSMNAVRQATESFMMMPAAVRARFHNDPQEFVTFCSDDRNRKEVTELGLVTDEAFKKHQAALKADAEALERGRAAMATPQPPREEKTTPKASKE